MNFSVINKIQMQVKVVSSINGRLLLSKYVSDWLRLTMTDS